MTETAQSAQDERFALLAELLWSASDYNAAPQQSAELLDQISQLLWSVTSFHQPHDPLWQ